jgi:hypothetical protein
MESVTHFITHRLKLKVNQAKSAVARPGQRKFLGFSFTGEREPRRRIAPKAIARFKERIREQTRVCSSDDLPSERAVASTQENRLNILAVNAERIANRERRG